MEIIPVIDLLHGKVVRAQRGQRDHYLPIHSQLCKSSEPVDIARALLELYPFKSLYIADLDAIQNIGNSRGIIQALLHDFPDLNLWLDCGLSNPENWLYRDETRVRCVLGSEALTSFEQYRRLLTALEKAEPILSLDFNHSGFIGPDTLLNQENWPSSLICMTLAKVGSYEGPDFDKLARLIQKDLQRNVYAAGGVRHLQDLEKLKTMNVTGALVASGLHDGKINASDIAKLMA